MIHSSDFGKDFKWGIATSAYQAEGAWNEDGKGESIWDSFSRQKGKIHANQNANVSCNFYNKFLHDLILMDYMNIRNFRFSISWPRIIPNGTGQTNGKGIEFYNRVIDFCLELGIEPWITLYHWDLPQALENKGGWTNRDIIHWFADYVQVCLKHFGDRVTNWMVLNEPMAFSGAGYYLGIHAPGKKGLTNFLAASHHAALCQAIGGHIIQAHSRLKAGTTFSFSSIDPATDSENDLVAAQHIDVLANRMFLEPLLGLGYPTRDLKMLEQIENHMQAGDEKTLRCDMDFVGIQCYTREVVKYSSFVPYIKAKLVKVPARKTSCTTMGWEVFPESMYRIIHKVGAYPQVKNMIVTENGAAFNDILRNGKVKDPERISYLQAYLSQVLRAKQEGLPVCGYFAWSFTDNFEWAEGFRQRFGLVYVDYATQRRYIKSSGHWYRSFLSDQATHLQRVAI